MVPGPVSSPAAAMHHNEYSRDGSLNSVDRMAGIATLRRTRESAVDSRELTYVSRVTESSAVAFGVFHGASRSTMLANVLMSFMKTASSTRESSPTGGIPPRLS